MFGKDVNDFFLSLILRTLRERESKNIVRPDMIHLLMEARKGNLSENNEPQKGKLQGKKISIAQNMLKI